MTRLTINDYKNILEFYKKPFPKSNRMLKLKAEKILANKLCRCIQKVKKTHKLRSIGICSKTIVNNKGYIRGKFSCKTKPTVKLTKKNKTNKYKKYKK